MKKLLACCVLALTAGYVQAQITAGKMMTGGSVEYISQKNESPYGDDKQKSLNLNPQFGYFVADNLVVGLEVSYYRIKRTPLDQNTDTEYDTKYTITTLSPFVRYYIFTPNEKFAFYAQARAGYGFSKYKHELFDTESEGNAFSAQVSPGFAYFLTEKWALDLQLAGITYTSADPNTGSDAKDDKSSSFSFGVSSLQPQLGFRYFFGN
jgi:outer membrane protein